MHKVLDKRLGGLSLPRKGVVRLTDRPEITLDVYRGRKTTIQQEQPMHTRQNTKLSLPNSWLFSRGIYGISSCILVMASHSLVKMTNGNQYGRLHFKLI